MKEKVYAFIFAVLIAVVGYITVTTAAAHTARDNTALLQWRYEHAVRP